MLQVDIMTKLLANYPGVNKNLHLFRGMQIYMHLSYTWQLTGCQETSVRQDVQLGIIHNSPPHGCG